MMTPEALRRQLCGAGFSPIPCNGKMPAPKAWEQKVETNSKEISLWTRVFPNAENTGILTRRTPCIDIDILNPEAAKAVEELARDRFEERGYILVRIGLPPKRAILLRTDKPFPKIIGKVTAPHGDCEQKIELLCDGQQVIVAGIHPDTHKPYSWHGGEPGQVKWEDLPYVSEDDARQFVIDAVQLLESYGYKAAQQRPKERVNGTAPGSVTNGHADWLYLLGNINSGHELHDTTCSLAAKLITSGMKDGAAVNLIRAVMETSPITRDARWYDRYGDIPRTVSSAREKFSQPESGIHIRSDGSLGETPDKQPAFSWKDFVANAKGISRMQFDPVLFLVRDLIPNEGICLICAKPKVGKSWLVLDIALAATMNRHVLGDIKPLQGDVLYLALEDSERRLKSRMTKLLPGYTGEWPAGLTFATQWRRLDLGGLDDIREWVAEKKAANRPVAFIAVDVLKMVRPPGKAGQSHYDADYEAIKGLHQLSVELGLPIIIVHHTRKADAEDLLDKVSGTFGLSGAADTIIIIDSQSQGTVFDVRGRDVESNTLAVQFSKDTCRWTILGNAAAVHRSDTKTKILDALTSAEGPMGPKDISAVTGLKESNVKMTLARMLRDGEVSRPAGGQWTVTPVTL